MSYSEITPKEYIARHNRLIAEGLPTYTGIEIKYTSTAEIAVYSKTAKSGVAKSRDGNASYHDVTIDGNKFGIVATKLKMHVMSINQRDDVKSAYPKKKIDNQTDFDISIPCDETMQKNDESTIEFYTAIKYLDEDLSELIKFKRSKDNLDTNGEISHVFNAVYSKKAKDPANVGKPRKTPFIPTGIKLYDHAEVPAEIKIPYTKIYNLENAKIDEKTKRMNWGKPIFNGEPILPRNLKDFFTPNSFIWYFKGSVQVTQSIGFVNINLDAREMAIRHIPGGAFGVDSDLEMSDDMLDSFKQLQLESPAIPPITQAIDPEMQKLFHAQTNANDQFEQLKNLALGEPTS